MLPFKSENSLRRIPIINIAMIVACVWVFVVVQPTGHQEGETKAQSEYRDQQFRIDNAAIPCELTRNKPITEDEVRQVFEGAESCMDDPTGDEVNPDKHIYRAIGTSMFLHAGWLHLLGNMLFLWVFGNSVEDRIGRVRYLVFYLAAGLAALVGHVIAMPHSALAVVGASGAIAGVMGAYLVLFPRGWVNAWMFFWVSRVPAAAFLILWFVSQFFYDNSRVAWVAHATGFAFGAVVAVWLRRIEPKPGREVALREGSGSSDVDLRGQGQRGIARRRFDA